MKALQLLFLCLGVLTFAACGNDDDEAASCMASDFTGTYAGTLTCDEDEPDDVPTVVTVNITEGTADNTIRIGFVEIFDGGTTEVDLDVDIPVSGCTATFNGTEDGITFTYSVRLDGDRVTVEETVSVAGGESGTCTYTAER